MPDRSSSLISFTSSELGSFAFVRGEDQKLDVRPGQGK
jgi:hypothetical protein